MGIFDKLMFWKKSDEDFRFDSALDKEMGKSSLPESFDLEQKQRLGLDEPSAFGESPASAPSAFSSAAPQPPAQFGGRNTDIELLNSKLDTIKAILNSLDQRMANLERNLGQKQPPKLW